MHLSIDNITLTQHSGRVDLNYINTEITGKSTAWDMDLCPHFVCCVVLHRQWKDPNI
jgi:hypothetical protein